MADDIIPAQTAREAGPLDALLAGDERAAERLFNRLPVAQQVRQVIAAPWNIRVRMILLAQNARAVVRALPPDELYWTVKHHGVEDALAVISLTSHEQFQYVVDMDCWSHDELDPAALTRWYRLLSKCHETKVHEWFSRADEPLLVGSLQQFLHVAKIEERSDITEEYARMPAATLDNVYYFNFIRDEAQTFIMPMLNAVYQNDPQRLYSLLEGVQNDCAAEVVEEALRWRKSRIAEHGFPDPEEAASIYQFVSDKEIGLLRKGCGHRPEDADRGVVSGMRGLTRYSLSAGGMPKVLEEALLRLPSDEVRERVQRLIVHVANKVLCADGRPVNSAADAAHGMKKALGLVGTGLEILSEEQPETAATQLAQVHPEILFRIGSSAVLALQSRLREIRATFWRDAPAYCVPFFDTPWSDALQGLLLKRPLVYAGLFDPATLEYRDVMTLQDVRALQSVVDTVEAVSSLLFAALRIAPGFLFGDFVTTTTIADPAELRSTAVFMTVAANRVVSGHDALQPLTVETLRRFLQTVFTFDGQLGRHVLHEAFVAGIRQWVASVDPCAERLRDARNGFVDVCLRMLEEEFSSLIGKKTIDARYVTGLLLSSRA